MHLCALYAAPACPQLRSKAVCFSVHVNLSRGSILDAKVSPAAASVARTLRSSVTFPTATKMLPLRLTVEEFSSLIRLTPEVVRRKIRAGLINAKGRPHLIPRSELAQFDVSISDATVFLEELARSKNTPALVAA